MTEKKIISFSGIKRLSQASRAKGRRIVFTNGCFDVIHAGHVRYLEKAKTFGDILIVGINSDSSVRKIKGTNRPVVKQQDRAAVIASLEAVDCVVIFSEATPLNLIRAIRPDVLVKGADWEIHKIVGGDFVTSYGGKVRAVSLLKGRSTSGLIEAILKKFK